MIKKIKALLEQYKEIVLYLFFGGLTTLVNIVSYFVCTDIFNIYYLAATAISWALSVAFAYVTNKKFVFKSRYSGLSGTAKEMASFVSSRIASLLAEVISMYFFVQICQIDDNIVKLMNQVLVTVLNYIFSKFWVFRKSGKSQANAGK